MFQQVDDDIYTIFNRWLRKRRDQIKDGKPVHGSALSFRNASHWPAATCHSGSARRRFSGGGRDASSSSSRLSTSSRASSSLSRTFLMRLALICTYNPPADCFNLSLHAPS